MKNKLKNINDLNGIKHNFIIKSEFSLPHIEEVEHFKESNSPHVSIQICNILKSECSTIKCSIGEIKEGKNLKKNAITTKIDLSHSSRIMT